jgi:hypothetical protein
LPLSELEHIAGWVIMNQFKVKFHEATKQFHASAKGRYRPEARERQGTRLGLGLVQKRRFLGNSTDDERALTVQGSQRAAATTGSSAAEAGIAEHFQPMGLRLPGQ